MAKELSSLNWSQVKLISELQKNAKISTSALFGLKIAKMCKSSNVQFITTQPNAYRFWVRKSWKKVLLKVPKKVKLPKKVLKADLYTQKVLKKLNFLRKVLKKGFKKVFSLKKVLKKIITQKSSSKKLLFIELLKKGEKKVF